METNHYAMAMDVNEIVLPSFGVCQYSIEPTRNTPESCFINIAPLSPSQP
jgi:hypothetical protein